MQKANAVYFWTVESRKRYYICRELKISKAEVLNYCRRFREAVKCKSKETLFYNKISLHYTQSILTSVRTSKKRKKNKKKIK